MLVKVTVPVGEEPETVTVQVVEVLAITVDGWHTTDVVVTAPTALLTTSGSHGLVAPLLFESPL